MIDQHYFEPASLTCQYPGLSNKQLGTEIAAASVLKELPATLILRPFNFETLAVRIYQLTSDERLDEASTAALAIIAAGIFPVIVLSRLMSQGCMQQSRNQSSLRRQISHD